MAHAKQLPHLATDEETLTTWFANALMRGYDERGFRIRREVAEGGAAHVRQLTLESVRGAVVRGWCAPLNEHKEMDIDLAEAIAQQVMALAPSPTYIERLQREHEEVIHAAQQALSEIEKLQQRYQVEAALV